MGLDGVCVKSHGGTDALGFAYAIGVAVDLVRYEYKNKLVEGLGKLHQVISAGAVNSGLFQMLVGKMLESGDLSGLKFTLSNAAKDLRYYTHFTESMMIPSIVGEAVHQSLVTANALGFGDKYVPSLIEAQEKLAGVEIIPRDRT